MFFNHGRPCVASTFPGAHEVSYDFPSGQGFLTYGDGEKAHLGGTVGRSDGTVSELKHTQMGPRSCIGTLGVNSVLWAYAEPWTCNGAFDLRFWAHDRWRRGSKVSAFKLF